jgi:hypothetical protein
VAIQPKSIGVLAGGRDLFNKEGIVSEKKIEDKDLQTLIAQPLWKAEEKPKKEKKKE